MDKLTHNNEQSPNSDKELVLLAKSELPHNTVSFERLTQRYHNVLYSICWRIVGDKFLAEDAYQNTMLKIFRYLEGFKMESSFKTWAYRIAFNESVSVKNAHKHELDDIRDYEAYDENSVLDDEMEVERLLSHLEEDERELMVLKYTVEMSDKEIAETMNISLSALKMRHLRIKKKLKEL